MISLSKITSDDTYGNIIIQESSKSEMGENESRMVRVPTLDGGSVIVRTGVSVTDQEFKIFGKIKKSEEDIIDELFRTSRILMSSKEGLFLVSIKKKKIKNGDLQIDIFINNEEN